MAPKRRSRAFLIRQAEVAAALGHRVELENRDRSAEFPDKGHAAIKWWAVCTCGYRSTVRANKEQALLVGFWHIGKVAGDPDEAIRNGAYAAPDTPPADVLDHHRAGR